MAGGKIDGDQKVMAAAQQIMKSLGTKNLTNDMLKALSQLDNRLASIHTNLIEQKIDAVEKVIRRWDSQCSNPRRRNSLRWEDSPFEAAEYLTAVDNVLDLIKACSIPPQDFELKERAEIIQQQAMCRMEDEFRRIMIRGTGPLDIDRLDRILEEKGRQQQITTGPPLDIDRLDRISEEKGRQQQITTGPPLDIDIDIDRLDRISEEKGRQQTERVENSTEEDTDKLERGENSIDKDKAEDTDNNKFVDLINPDAIPKLKEIADRMIKSGYEKECHQAYSSTLREVLDEFLLTLGSEKLSIEEVQKLEWKLLSEKMEKWNQALKSVVKVLLPSEKHLFDQIFGGSNSKLIREVCFIETSKVSVMQLLNFAEAIVIGKRSSEKLFQILDMHSALADVMPDLQALFPEDSIGGSVCSEAQAILKELGESAKGTLAEFENMVQNEASRKVFQGGDIHPLTRYVMNYVKFLVEYDSLSLLLECGTNDSYGAGGDKNTCSDIISLTPIGRFLRSLFSSLELNLKEKSKMYEDGGLQYVFQMNNILYVVQKVKEDSELGKLLGDNWVRQHRGQVRQYANSYLRAAWSKALSFLKDEGLGGGGSASNVSRLILKERFKNFNACFEEIYRNQTAWKVPDSQLREELRLSISEKVLPAYRSFVGRFHSHLDRGRSAGKYIKYSPDDLEDFLLDLFEGTPAILHHPRRKLSA